MTSLRRIINCSSKSQGSCDKPFVLLMALPQFYWDISQFNLFKPKINLCYKSLSVTSYLGENTAYFF